MPDANLYLDQIDYTKYLDVKCQKCGKTSCKELVEKLQLPKVSSLQMPHPAEVGVIELNNPGPKDPILITGNSQFTQEVLLAILSETLSPFFLVMTDTRGDTLDMAVILQSFTPSRIKDTLEREKVLKKSPQAWWIT